MAAGRRRCDSPRERNARRGRRGPLRASRRVAALAAARPSRGARRGRWPASPSSRRISSSLPASRENACPDCHGRSRWSGCGPRRTLFPATDVRRWPASPTSSRPHNRPRWLLAISQRDVERSSGGDVARRAFGGGTPSCRCGGCRARTARRSRAIGRFLEGGPTPVATDRGHDEGIRRPRRETQQVHLRPNRRDLGGQLASRPTPSPARPRGRSAAGAAVTVAGVTDEHTVMLMGPGFIG